MPHLLRDLGNELDGGGAGADHSHPLAAEIDGLLGPARGVKGLAAKALDAGDVRHMGRGEDAHRGDQVLGARAAAVLGFHFPATGGLIEMSRGHPRTELDVGRSSNLSAT